KEKKGLGHLLEKNERKFRNSEMEKNRISEVFTNFNEGILVLDENERVSAINPLAKKILGIKTRDIKGAPVMDLGRLFDVKPFVPYFLSLNGILKQQLNFKNLIVELSVIPLIFEEKNMGKLIILRDITGESLLEKTKNDFILSAVHQLKTSVASAKWSLKMFLSGDFGNINKEQKDVIGRLYKRNDGLVFSINNLLDATKIEDGVYAYNKNLADIQEIVESVVLYFKDKIKSKKIKFEFERPSERFPKIMIDKEKIESVIQNLLDNALKYTGNGGEIKVSLKINDKNIEFRIGDSGIGIPNSQQGKIFSKFFRAGNANKMEATGSGLGLFIAKNIIEDHNGSIRFESEENKGSVFVFTLPIEGV
ncbi:MAG: PAS domain-containing sensor histidine kinase, partial [Patescibacteria group bacterium]